MTVAPASPSSKQRQVTCPVCAKEFTVSPETHGTVWLKVKFCSKDCRQEQNRRRSRQQHAQQAHARIAAGLPASLHGPRCVVPARQIPRDASGHVILNPNSPWENWCEFALALVTGQSRR